MAEETKPVKIDETAGAHTTDDTSTVTIEDAEARIAELEAEKLKAIEEASNYKVAFLKEKSKNKQGDDDDDESEDERIERKINEKLAATKIAQIDAEKEALIQKTLKENKELKLAVLNKTGVPAFMGTHNESIEVKDTAVTPDQMAAFKAKGWSDKDIERYKKNLNRYAGR